MYKQVNKYIYIYIYTYTHTCICIHTPVRVTLRWAMRDV